MGGSNLSERVVSPVMGYTIHAQIIGVHNIPHILFRGLLVHVQLLAYAQHLPVHSAPRRPTDRVKTVRLSIEHFQGKTAADPAQSFNAKIFDRSGHTRSTFADLVPPQPIARLPVGAFDLNQHKKLYTCKQCAKHPFCALVLIGCAHAVHPSFPSRTARLFLINASFQLPEYTCSRA